MADLHGLLDAHVRAGELPGAVALVARGDRVEVAAVGSVDVDGTGPMMRDTIVRVASITKPITAAATMVLVDDGRISFDDPVARWLPELASPSVVRTPGSPVDDVVPAARPITVMDLLTFRAGWGFPSDFSLPAVQPLFSELHQGPYPAPMGPDAWMATLARIPLLHQPGTAWLYNTCADILGVLVARAAGQPFDVFLAERLFEPLGMADTGFWVPPARLGRFGSLYGLDPAGSLRVADTPDGRWSSPPEFLSGAGGLVSTVDDWYSFARMLLAGGEAGGRRILSRESVRAMMTDHLTAAQRAASTLFLEGQGWGFGGSVDIARTDPWTAPGRYGWVGGTGTSAYLNAGTGAVNILLTQRMMAGPTPTDLMREFWSYAAA